MKKKGIFSLALASILCLSFVGMATACGDKSSSGGNGDQQQNTDNNGNTGAEKTSDLKITLNINDNSMGTATLSDPKSAASGYVKDEKVTVTVTPKAGYLIESVKADDTALTGSKGGKYTFTITKDTTVAVTFAEDVIAPATGVEYPKDPKFVSLADDSNENKSSTYKSSYKAHDPVAVEARYVSSSGKLASRYYAFSTDNDGGYGVQVRSSYDFSVWDFEGVAIEGFANGANGVVRSNGEAKALYSDSNFHLNPIYEWIKQGSEWNDSTTGTDANPVSWTLWAPDVVPAADNPDAMEDGHWWMYSCWTTKFGSMRSIIFKLNANNVKGPYTFDTVIVRDADTTGEGGGINEIDPSIYYSNDGTRMFMSYGSYGDGFGVIELDPQTGHRKNATEADTVAGKAMVTDNGFNAEGSSVAYYERDVYTGNIATEEYDASKWEKQGKYIMMGSDGNLSTNYVMRTWESDTPDGPFTSDRGGAGFQVGGNWSWAADKTQADAAKELNYYIPGHNDMLTTSDGRHLIVYHTRVSETSEGYDTGEHYLYTSLIDFNSKGQLVINPNRYAGDRDSLAGGRICPVTKADLLTKTNGKYSVVRMTSSDPAYTEKREVEFAENCTLGDGTLTIGSETGTWKLYGSHYIYIKIGADEYYGTVMPAWIRQYDETAANKVKGNGGLTISAVTDVKGGENKIIYFNMQF